MIKLIKNNNKLSEYLKEDKVAKSKKIRESFNSRYSLNSYPEVLGYVVVKVDRRSDYTLDYFSTFKQRGDALKEMDRLNSSNKDRSVYYDIAEVDENSELASELKEDTSLETSFEVDEIGDRPIHKQIKSTNIPSSRQIREIIDSYDLDELEDSNSDVIDDTINEIILDCIDEVKNKPEPFTQAWDDLYEKLETIVYRIVKRQYGFIKSLDEDKQIKSKRQNSRVEKIDKLIDDIYDERKSSISKDGEYGVGNQTFKEFRNRGYLDKLKKLKQKELNKELSLEELETKETCK